MTDWNQTVIGVLACSQFILLWRSVKRRGWLIDIRSLDERVHIKLNIGTERTAIKKLTVDKDNISRESRD